jgi:hypothetical protein
MVQVERILRHPHVLGYPHRSGPGLYIGIHHGRCILIQRRIMVLQMLIRD